MDMTVDLHELVNHLEQLSPLPELWEQAVEQTLQGTLRLDDLLSWMQRDVALTLRVLAVANSDEYGKPELISTLRYALEYLGLDLVQNLILSTPSDDMARLALYGKRLDFIEFWKHCLACSILTERIAEYALPGMAAEARVAGLLHDVGKLLLNLSHPDQCQKIIPEKGKKAFRFQEEDVFGLTHAEIGGQALKQLRMPLLLQSSCSRHHCNWEDLNLGQEPEILAACVNLADFLSYRLNLGSGGNHARSMESLPDYSRLGLNATQLETLQQNSLEQYQQVLADIQPGTMRSNRQFQLMRRANLALGHRSFYLNKNVAELSRLQEVHEELNHTVDLDELLPQVSLRLGTLFSAEVIAFLLLLENGAGIHYFSKLPLSADFLSQSQDFLLESFSESQQREVRGLNSQVTLLVPDATEGRFQLKEFRSAMNHILQGREGQIGRLAFYSSVVKAFSRAEENLAGIIAGEVALALDRAHWMRRTEILSITDGLTGLYNHRRFLQILEHEFSRSRRYRTPMCLLMIDIDHFKMLNDTYGHQQGDRMLKALAGIFKEATRESDMLTRYGGEEFAIVLPSTELDGGKVTAERIRRAVETYAFPNPGNSPLRMTVSIGVSFYAGEGAENPKDLIEEADQALYRAKQRGRNMTIIYSES